MSFRQISFLFLLLMMFILSGCGDLLGSKVNKRQLEGLQEAIQCDLDVNRFQEIMNENIENQIRCLGENLNFFIKIVKSGKPGYLSRVELERYLADFRPDVKPEVIKALKSIFDLGHLITGEDPDYISKTTVDKVMDFGIIFNREAALILGERFKDENTASWTLHNIQRGEIAASTKAIIQGLRVVFNQNRNGQIHKLDILQLIDSFSTESNRETLEKAKKVLFIKKILLGGDEDIITHQELERLILNFDHLVLIGFDIVRYKFIQLDQNSILQLLKTDVNDLYKIVTQGPLNNRDNETLFTINKAIDAVKLFVEKEDFDIEQFRNLISEAKVIALKGNTQEVKGSELKALFDHAKSLLQTGTVFHRIYDKFSVQLDSPEPVTIDFEEYRHTYPEHQAELDQFERIVKKYRFMKGRFLSSFYTRSYKRNSDAVFEIAMIEYIMKLAFAHYGNPSPNEDAVGGYSLDQTQMRKMVKDFENELIELDILLPQRVNGTADNVSLLGTLFQYQSDKNGFLDVNEGTEFAISLFSSLNVADDLFLYMEEQNCPKDQFDRFEPGCVRNNFFKGLCKNYQKQFPLMFTSLNTSADWCDENDFVNTPEADAFLDRAIEAARTCNYYTDGNKEEIHYSKADFMTIMVALMHVETTVMRWDNNSNNILDSYEVDKAYEIYSPALDGFLKDKNPVIKGFKKQIFQYMIKYEQIPDEKDFGSIWKFIKFLMRFDKKSPAKRKTIASILVAISEQNKILDTSPQFDCNLLRNPDTIPRTQPVAAPKAKDTRPDYSYLLEPYLHLAQ